MKWLYALLNCRWLVNIPICIAVAYLAVRWVCRIWFDEDIRLYRPILAIVGLVILHYGSNVEYAKIVGNFDFKFFITIILVTLLSIMCIKIIGSLMKNCQKTGDKNGMVAPKGFSDDKVKVSSEHLLNYAGEIVERLLVTDIKENSYALGITGEWGVGKTTFLDDLKKKINGRAEIVEFNPWMCSSPEQLTNDFFASLRHQLSPKYSTLSRSIKEYAKYINSVTLAPHSTFSLDVLWSVKPESLFERKKTLSKKFEKLPKPVVVIIDDVDRLERDEVFEVLRLIRNTADLSNVIYIVAYDKEYVTCVLEEKNIKDSSAYLEKIFPIEVHLPKVEDWLIWDTLYSEIERQNNINENFAKNLLMCFNSDDKELILRILNSYRRVKRFARLFVLNYAYVYQHSRNELKICDIFWLELLQMYDKHTFEVLAEDSRNLLYYDNGRMRMKNGILQPAREKDQNIFQGTPFWKEETPKLLEKMFGNYIKTIQQSICYAENYYKFFTLSVSPFRLSIAEFQSLFAEGVKADEVVEKWVDEGKYLSSIMYQFKQININEFNEIQLKTYLHGLLGLGMMVFRSRNRYVWELKKMLRKEYYVKNGLEDKAHGIILKWIQEKSNNDNIRSSLSKMLNVFYTPIVVDDEEYPTLLIGNAELEELLKKLMKDYLIEHPEVSALDVLSEKETISCIFRNCCVAERESVDMEFCEYKQIAFDIIIEHFSKKTTKPTIDECEKALDALFYKATPEFKNQYEEDYAYEEYKNKMQAYFGSSFDKESDGKLLEFKEKCFIAVNNQTVEA